MNQPRRGASSLFVIGLILWALVFAGLFFLKYRGGDGGKVDAGDPRDREGTLDLNRDDAPVDVMPEETSKPVVFEDDAGNPLPATWDPDGIEDFSLTERDGRTITKQDLIGKPWVVGFVFTRCQGPCPKVSKTMHDLQKATEDLDLRLVTITVDPEYDTPEVLTRYADIYIADPERWLFLTGTEEEIYPLIGRSFKMPVQRVATPGGEFDYDVVHTTNVLYVDAEGVVRGKYNSLDERELGELKAKLRKEVSRVEEVDKAETE